jgi:hypothetical protein
MSGKLLIPVEWRHGYFQGNYSNWVFFTQSKAPVAQIIKVSSKCWQAEFLVSDRDCEVGHFRTLKEAKLAIEKKLGVRRS